MCLLAKLEQAAFQGFYGTKEFLSQQSYFGGKFLSPAEESKDVPDDL